MLNIHNLIDFNYIKRAIKIFIMATILLLITIIIAYIFTPGEELLKQLGNKSPERVSETHGLTKVWGFIQTNGFHVTIQMLILALIPIPFLYTLNLIVSIIIPGIMFGFLINFDPYKGFTGFISYIPHYMFEIFSFCVMVSGLYMLNKTIIRKISNIFRKNKKRDYSLRISLIMLFKLYFLVSLPLIVLAAFTETYVADMLLKLMN